MTHPNDMSSWAAIECQRGVGHMHHSRTVHVDLAQPHGYRDCPQVPTRLAASFDLVIWDPARHPVDGGPYCPAHDAVSETIVSHGIWEPRETILAAQVCSTAEPDSLMFDLGAQLGWYTVLAATMGLHACAVDGEAANLELLERSALLNGLDVLLLEDRIGPGTEPLEMVDGAEVRFAKVDLEGADADGVRMLWPYVEAGLLDHLLVEVSPVFVPGPHYPDLVCRIIDAGYEAYRLPPKQQPPYSMQSVGAAMAPQLLNSWPREDLRSWVEGCHQEDLWFRRQGATW